jgi:hypothetical protein
MRVENNLLKIRTKVLHLTLKKNWFDLIKQGIKKEEYRDIKVYFIRRFKDKPDIIHFRNGYNLNCPELYVECKEISTGIGKKEWGAPKYKVFILKLGKIVDKKFIIK